MTPKERAAMQQALEALESAPVQYDFNSYPMLVMTPDTLQTTLTALREALAEQAEQEPVAWKQTVRALTDQCAALIQERDELQKQVWRYEKHGVTCQTYGHKVESSCAECNENEIYAAPVRTKDLTDDEIEIAMEASGIPYYDITNSDLIDFARTVIAAYRKKNNV